MNALLQKKIVIPAVVVVAVILLVLVLRPTSLEVTAATASMDTLSVTIPVEGRTRARDLYTVTAPISGRIARLTVEEGTSVEAGDLLGRMFAAPLDPRTVAAAQAELRAAEAGLLNARSAVDEARSMAAQSDREVERRRPLAAMGALSAEALEQAVLGAQVAHQRLESATAASEAAEAAREGARARLMGLGAGDANTQGVAIIAPVAGRVLRITDESERVLAAGSPILELANTGGLEVVLDVLSEDAVRVEAGHELRITGWGGDGTLIGTVRSVTLAGYTKISALGVEEQRVDVIADLAGFPETLGTGYRVQGEIVVWQGSALSVPTSALFRAGNDWQLFRIEDGQAARQMVRIGHRNEASVEILEGLSEGDEVVLFPSEEVDDGVAVRALGR